MASKLFIFVGQNLVESCKYACPKKSFFMQSRERLSKHGVLVLHLGKSKKCDMAECLIKTANKWFSKYDLFTEDVSHCQNFGIKDIGTVDKHQFLILR